jgi:hypothetical protein
MNNEDLVEEISYLLGSIRDPERCETLEELEVITKGSVEVHEFKSYKVSHQ